VKDLAEYMRQPVGKENPLAEWMRTGEPPDDFFLWLARRRAAETVERLDRQALQRRTDRSYE